MELNDVDMVLISSSDKIVKELWSSIMKVGLDELCVAIIILEWIY